ncbi:MAG: YkgJ family cysteine cluster protein [Planctomycetota bacterium]
MSRPWFAQGLNFECQRCRGCCRGEPGFVWVSEGEVRRLAAVLGRVEADFRGEYCRKAGGRTSLRERPDGDCVLLGPEGCIAYEDRPVQCRTFPFWPENLRRPGDWERLGRECPGVDRGRIHTFREISRAMAEEKGGG